MILFDNDIEVDNVNKNGHNVIIYNYNIHLHILEKMIDAFTLDNDFNTSRAKYPVVAEMWVRLMKFTT